LDLVSIHVYEKKCDDYEIASKEINFFNINLNSLFLKSLKTPKYSSNPKKRRKYLLEYMAAS
jgi:hypothetical protein